MRIQDLDDAERIALGGLLRLMIRSDGDFSEEEEETVNQLGERHLGEPGGVWRLISASAQACPSDDEIRAAAQKVERGEARTLITSILEEVAAGDEVSDEERELLSWLGDAWG